ncbi:TonB-dependent receptor [Mucilaginibacter ginsenosidivorans]|uniref:PEGA domain-containing protein n=1 Tax=Mucilaginibacter ginsenosidivorans TaxID=398053 RepID=A0A5B8UPV6_9SPHI|nr:TonB-dependent receptor [Mucilaginibacter ginsenosidivorans]QEC61059.1 PEGA domain-containing protein [Mucilaginibacter ginsenosidivorans]
MKLFFTSLICLLSVSFSFASTISGYIFDKDSKEQLVGASILLSPRGIKTASMLNGKYQLNNIPAGTYHLKVSYIGYKTIDTTLTLKADENVKLNFYMTSSYASLSTVTISARGNRESDAYAKRAEQRANNLTNIVSANSIAISPDITVANVMARVSGVSVQRGNTGDGQYAIIRGMDPRYSTTLINGIKIPSPDNKQRYVPLDIFPADLIERIEVSKSLTPDMEGDASGGVINLVMKTAPDELRLEGNAAIGYSQIFSNRSFQSFNTGSINSRSPAEIRGLTVPASVSDFPYQNLIVSPKKTPVNSNFNLTIGDRFLNKKLGVIFSGTYQNTYAGNNTFRLVENATLGPAAGPNAKMTQVFPEYLDRQYSSLTNRLGLISTVDYQFNQDNSISLFGTYLQLDENRARLTNDLLLGNYSYQGYTGGFQQSYETQTRKDLQSIYSAILHGDNKLARSLTTDWSVAVSEAKQELPDMAGFNTTQQINPNTTGVATSVSYGPVQVRPETREWSHNTDKDISGYLNFHYNTDIKGHKTIIGFGGMARHKSRDNFDNQYTLNAVPDPDSTYQKYVSIPASKFFFGGGNGSDPLGNAASNAGVYTFTENVQAAYGQVKYFISERFDVLFGLRIENTSQSYVSSLPATIAGKSANISYTDYLPGINAKYSLSKTQALRASYFRSILRPAYSDLVPYPDNTGFGQDNFPTQGNPDLQHSVIDNYDFRYEVFPNGLDQFMVGAFYKTINNPIEYALVQTNFSASLTLSPNNFGTAHNYGIEAVFRKFFGNIGISGNYTYTHSLINSTKKFQYIDPTDNSFHNIEVSQPRPLQGQAAHVGNVSLLYKNTKNKIDAQLAMVYTGERINTLSLYKDLDNWERPTVNLDFSAQKEFSQHYIIYIKVNNLLNTPYELIVKQQNKAYSGNSKLPLQESPNYATIENDKYYARYLLGFRFKF